MPPNFISNKLHKSPYSFFAYSYPFLENKQSPKTTSDFTSFNNHPKNIVEIFFQKGCLELI